MKGKIIMSYYAIALIGGVVTGGLFSRAQYHKGKADAYAEISKDLEKLMKNTEERLEKRKVEEAN